MSEGAGRRLRIRPEFRRRLALLHDDDQQAILDRLEQISTAPLSSDDITFAVAGIVVYLHGREGRLWIDYRLLDDGSLSILTCGVFDHPIMMM